MCRWNKYTKSSFRKLHNEFTQIVVNNFRHIVSVLCKIQFNLKNISFRKLINAIRIAIK